MAVVPDPAIDDDESEGEEEEESEEAQVCWSMVFTFLPLIWTIATEFAAEAAEAVRCEHMPQCERPQRHARAEPPSVP